MPSGELSAKVVAMSETPGKTRSVFIHLYELFMYFNENIHFEGLKILYSDPINSQEAL